MDEVALTKAATKITMTGSPTLDPTLLKSIKKACRNDDRMLRPLYEVVKKQLKKNHSEIRLSAFQLLAEIFDRSHKFRVFVLDDLDFVFGQTLETAKSDLPPPIKAAKSLRALAAETVFNWSKKFGPSYKKIVHGYNYLKQVKRVVFNDIEGRSEAERRREEERTLKMANIWRERVKRTQEEMNAKVADMEDALAQMQGCFDLLIPKPENFLFDSDPPASNEGATEEGLECHGIIDPKARLSIDVTAERSKSVADECDESVLENLQDQFNVLVNRLLPMAKKWVVTLTKAGTHDALLKRAIDMKARLDVAEEKAGSFKDKFKRLRARAADSDSDDGDDFVEVEDKPGYEAVVQADQHDLGIPFYSRPSTSSTRGPLSTRVPEATRSSWTIRDGSEDTSDPTTMSATLNKLKKGPDEPHSSQQKGGGRSEDSVVRRPYDTDLYNWEEDRQPQQVNVPHDGHRFWGASREEDVLQVPGSDSRQRVIAFTGEFERVKWSCRAPLPSGRLCPRKDRFKCPFHGKVIPRDEQGQPAAKEGVAMDSAARASEANDDWQDPDLLRDIEAATGLNLKVSGKGKGRGKRSRRPDNEPGLTDIKRAQNTSRKRLEKVVFNRSAMKRVASDMNRLESKKFKDKFGDQFNYIYE